MSMMRACKKSTKDGYVVTWYNGHSSVPLCCFGDYKSAATEFCNILNNKKWDGKASQIKTLAKEFDPADKYLFPEFNGENIVLTKQQKL